MGVGLRSNHENKLVRALGLQNAGLVLLFALAGVAGVDFALSHSLALKFGQTTVSQPGNPQAPSLNISDMMAAAR
jgi:hypothetical protein